MAALALAACNGSSGSEQGTASVSAEVAEQQLTRKLNIYVACINAVNPAVRYSQERYLGWADRAKGPKLADAGQGVGAIKRETTYGYSCFQENGGLGFALTSEPKLVRVDAAGAAYQKALDAVIEVTSKAATYYDHGDYKDDALAQGKAMHAPLVEAFDAFFAASHALGAALEEQQDQLTVKELAELEKTEGKKARWHQRTLMRAAGLLVRALIAADDADLGKGMPQITAYITALTELTAWTRANQAEADKLVSWSSFGGYADDLYGQLKELQRATRDGRKPPTSGAGSVESVITKYNQLVDASNGLWN